MLTSVPRWSFAATFTAVSHRAHRHDFRPFLCSAQDQNALKEKLHTKQLAGTSADTMGYVEAFTEVKRLFTEGAFGEAWKAPYYWAPFVYYGQ